MDEWMVTPTTGDLGVSLLPFSSLFDYTSLALLYLRTCPYEGRFEKVFHSHVVNVCNKVLMGKCDHEVADAL